MAKMTEEKFMERRKTLLLEELSQPEKLHYVSFADRRFLGGVVVLAHGITDALLRIHALDISPGGQVLCCPIPGGMTPEPKYHNRLLTAKEVKEIWPDAKRLGDFEAEAKDGKKTV